MDYEKLYKEALERARQFSKKPYLEDSKDIVEYIFPELKEDEKISREITEFLVGFNNGGYETPNENTIDSWLAWLEKQGEKKLADKVEPKFKVGDWIVRDDHLIIGKVISFDGRRHWYNDVKCSCSVKQPLFFNEEDRYHIWTIQDAKDGDILSWDDSKCIALFKNIYNEESIISHGFVGHCSGTFKAEESYHDIEGVHPATKEQRGILFQKMKEAGYEWDKNKKELNPVWSAEDMETIDRIYNFIWKNRKGDTSEIYQQENDANWLKSLKDRKQQPK